VEGGYTTFCCLLPSKEYFDNSFWAWGGAEDQTLPWDQALRTPSPPIYFKTFKKISFESKAVFFYTDICLTFVANWGPFNSKWSILL
jgi:hypothetical protein